MVDHSSLILDYNHRVGLQQVLGLEVEEIPIKIKVKNSNYLSWC